MRSWHVVGGLTGFFIVFFVGLGLWFASEGELESADFASKMRNSGVKMLAKDNRSFEKSEITSQIDAVKDEPSALFNDPAIAQAWGLKKADAARAWSVSKGSRSIVVCVIDTGVDVDHEDLKGNLWTNPCETGIDDRGRDKATNGVDDACPGETAGNGFIDDVHGWNFVANNNDLTDNHGHGTHISGIIGAEAGNGKGISGVSPQVSIMSVKYYDPKVPNTDNLKNTILGIKYCVKMGAHIINYSGGGTEFSQEEHDAVAEADRKNILFVAAAGNERSNSDQHRYYPADYRLRNIISVTAIDPNTDVLPSSNFGTETVDIGAPGQNVLSTLPRNSYGFMTGTSQATAFVTGAAALVMAHKKTFGADEVKKYILSTGDATTSLAAKTKTSRQLNLFKALTILDANVGASGLTTANANKETMTFTLDGGRRGQATGGFSGFGKNLMEAVQGQGKKKPLDKTKLGQKREDGEAL